MGFFEENPIVFVLAVIAIVEAWLALKKAILAAVARRRDRPLDDGRPPPSPRRRMARHADKLWVTHTRAIRRPTALTALRLVGRRAARGRRQGPGAGAVLPCAQTCRRRARRGLSGSTR
jgi:hypothetical protein